VTWSSIVSRRPTSSAPTCRSCCPASLAFLERFTTQTKVDWLTPARLGAWLARIGYSGKVAPEVLHQRLLAAPRGTTDVDTEAHAATTLAFVALLRTLNTQITALAESIADQLEAHPDANIVKSLPRAGTLRAARLLAEIGDARGRFPTPDSLACLAGVAPSTRQSGKTKAVTFRWSADKELRDALCDFAGDCRRANPWAEDLYQRARARGHDHPHAVRILGRAWANIIWRCWQDGVAYDPTRHNALQRVLNEHAANAA
jgi:transposase